MADLGKEGVSTYPTTDLEIDEEDATINEGLRVSLPRVNKMHIFQEYG